MKQLDRYIIGKYLRTFFFTAFLFTLIAMVFDFSEKVEKFLKLSIPAKEIIFEHYLNYIPYINGQLWALYALISVIFFTSRMAYNSEIISIFNAGVSFYRMMVPYLITALLLSLIYLVGNHVVIPEGNKSRLGFEYKYIYTESDRARLSNVHMFIDADTKIFAKYYSQQDTNIRDFRLEKFKDGELIYLLTANKAEWAGEPNQWKIYNYEIRTFDGVRESLTLGKNKQFDTTLNLRHQDFIYYSNQKQGMNTFDLQRFITRERERGIGNTQVYELEMHKRTAEPFTVLILTIIGVAIAARKVRGGMGLHLATGIVLGALYIFLSKFSITFAANDVVPPLLGVWIPNLVFIGVALRLVATAQK
jgi:lipopolysaccharide export system permease protein